MSHAESQPTILFDEDCSFCRTLAELSARRSAGQLQFIAWQRFRTSPEATQYFDDAALAAPADKLRVLAEGKIFEAASAWEWLLSAHPDLRSLAWMAEKLGLTRPTAKIFERTGHALRWLCGCCRREMRR